MTLLRRNLSIIAAGAACSVFSANAQISPTIDKVINENIEEMTIFAEVREALPGSAYALDKEALEAFNYTDINRVVSQIPGLYVRNEDGFGLRPNIGIRGATADRSQKITLMEDGILIKPAPYSAPTAYYFPNVNRMHTVEVAKGPATIKYGPHTVGGAMNLVTPPVPQDETVLLKLSAGDFGFQSYQARYGNKHGNIAYWVEGFHFQSDGFKELDGGGDTGFERSDFNAKIQWQGDKQSLTAKFGYADETSNETYLGLTDADFAVNPNRRYRASQIDLFTSVHRQAHVLHHIEFSDSLKLNSAFYSNSYRRGWNKLDGFVGSTDANGNFTGIPINSVLAEPNIFQRQVGVLRGDINSNGTAAELIDITNNDRYYASQGLQFNLDYEVNTGNLAHDIDIGLRFHNDYVERLHTPKHYNMVDGQLVLAAQQNGAIKAYNHDETDAVSFYISDTIKTGNLALTLGVRAESIDATADDYSAANADNRRSTDVVTPGIGATYDLGDHWLLLAGVYQGFSPAGPQATEAVESEETVNIEYGLRYISDELNIDAIAFFSDYSNFIGRCRASDVGCTVGSEFNGGAVEVSGVELLISYEGQIGSVHIPLSVNYTFTDSAFQQRFESDFSQWGLVQAGDELPYVPQHIARLNAGLEGIRWGINIGLSYSSETRDVPGQGQIAAAERIDSRTIIDISGKYEVNERLRLGLAVDNINDQQNIVSRRPFGARPDKPRSVIGSITYSF